MNECSLLKRRLLITGGNGFLGGHVCAAAARLGAQVAVLDLPGTGERAARVRASLGCPPIRQLEMRASDSEAFGRALEKVAPEGIVHLAGNTSRQRSAEAWLALSEANVVPTAALLKSVAALPQERRPVLVLAGSQMEYGAAPAPWVEEGRCLPTNPYGATKLAAAELALAAARAGTVRASVARLAIVYGEAQPPSLLIPEIIANALRGVATATTRGAQRRRFAYVGDVAGFLLELLGRLIAGEPVPALINAPAGLPVAVGEVAQEVVRQLGGESRLSVGAIAERPGEIAEAWPQTLLAESLGLAATTPLAAGLAATVAWYRSNGWFLEEVGGHA